MKVTLPLIFSVLFCKLCARGKCSGIRDEPQISGYVQVRPGAHMFWWLCFSRRTQDITESPLVMYLEGGPGAPSSGTSNFLQMGPLDEYLRPRVYSWTNYTNILFVDSPVGSGWSFVEDPTLLNRNNDQAAQDLVRFTTQFFEDHSEFQNVSLYIFGHSYGGRIRCNLQGVTFADAWISPVDSVLTWAPYLYTTSLIDSQGAQLVSNSAQKVKEAIDSSNLFPAFLQWNKTRALICQLTNNVDFSNILRSKQRASPQAQFLNQQFSPREVELFGRNVLETAAKYLIEGYSDYMLNFMNGRVRQALGTIPRNVRWGGQGAQTFAAMAEDRMRPVVHFIERILNECPTLTVTVWNGQLDLTDPTIGILNWVENMNWPGIDQWKMAYRQPIVLDDQTAAFVKSNDRLSFYWILRAGHRVQADVPANGVEVLQRILRLK